MQRNIYRYAQRTVQQSRVDQGADKDTNGPHRAAAASDSSLLRLLGQGGAPTYNTGGLKSATFPASSELHSSYTLLSNRSFTLPGRDRDSTTLPADSGRASSCTNGSSAAELLQFLDHPRCNSARRDIAGKHEAQPPTSRFGPLNPGGCESVRSEVCAPSSRLPRDPAPRQPPESIHTPHPQHTGGREPPRDRSAPHSGSSGALWPPPRGPGAGSSRDVSGGNVGLSAPRQQQEALQRPQGLQPPPQQGECEQQQRQCAALQGWRPQHVQEQPRRQHCHQQQHGGLQGHHRHHNHAPQQGCCHDTPCRQQHPHQPPQTCGAPRTACAWQEGCLNSHPDRGGLPPTHGAQRGSGPWSGPGLPRPPPVSEGGNLSHPQPRPLPAVGNSGVGLPPRDCPNDRPDSHTRPGGFESDPSGSGPVAGAAASWSHRTGSGAEVDAEKGEPPPLLVLGEASKRKAARRAGLDAERLRQLRAVRARWCEEGGGGGRRFNYWDDGAGSWDCDTLGLEGVDDCDLRWEGVGTTSVGPRM